MAPIQQGIRKGEPCGNHVDGTTYCSKHSRQAIMDKALAENIRYCDIARGCYTILEEHQSKCVRCLHAARIRDRKQDGKKRQDAALCLDCGIRMTENTHAVGKNNKLLRRCVPCYAKMQQYEAAREKKSRNYKAEAFTNKHVIWNHYVKGAQKRGIHFTLSKTLFESLIIQPCFYCQYIAIGEVNGIDRMDNQKGYIEGNVVTCCEICNFAKGSQHPLEFMDKLYAIHQYTTTHTPISIDKIEQWKTTYCSRRNPAYLTYVQSAQSRNITFSITTDQFYAITQQPCYLCGIETTDTNHNGIDREQNEIGYHLNNCKPCCGHCNLMKKDMQLSAILNIAEKVARRYTEICLMIPTIATRGSKIEPRIKIEDPIIAPIQPKEYKPINEVIAPPIPIIMDKKVIIPKQWKAKQIYESIQDNREALYRAHCEENNTLLDWTSTWDAFIGSVKGQPWTVAEPLIKAFVENLRRIRHNALCAKNPLEKEHQQWPATTVVRAFIEGKLDMFKAYTEAKTEQNPADPVWIARWEGFILSLEKHHDQPEIMKDLCSKFMTAQRIKKYRMGK